MNKQDKKPRQLLLSVLGWYGVVAIVGGYALLSAGILRGDGYMYHVLNLTGTFGVAAEAYSKRDMPPTALNVIMGLIAMFAIIRLAVL